jgi:hypothetical protein
LIDKNGKKRKGKLNEKGRCKKEYKYFKDLVFKQIIKKLKEELIL